MDYYQSNFEILKRCDPELADFIKETEENGRFEIITTKRGLKSIRVEGKTLHSLYDPWQEAKNLVSKMDLDKDIVIIFGFGLGYHILEVLKRIKKGTLVIVFEKSATIFKKALSEVDLSEILDSSQIRFSIGKNFIEIWQDLSRWIRIGEFRGLSLVEHPPSVALSPAYYSRIRTILSDIIHQKFEGMRTRLIFQTLWMRNLILNLPMLVTIPGVKHLFGKFENIPAFLIGAGPSLEKNIKELNIAKGRSLLIATDTALKPLLNSGVTPDIVLSCDGQDKSMGDFEGLGEVPSVLVAATLVYPEVLKMYQGPKMLFFIAQLRYTKDGKEIAVLSSLARWLEEITEHKGYLQAGGSVSTLAFDLSRNLGCNPIVFVGHDLAFTDNRLYCAGVDYIKNYRYMKEYMKSYMDSIGEIEGTSSFEAAYEKALREGVVDREFIKRRKHFYVPSIDLKGKVLTSDAFYTYLKWFEDAISRMTDRLFINATEGGASIAGTKVMRLSEAIGQYCQREVDIRLLNEMANIKPSIDIESVIRTLREVITRLEELSKVSYELVYSHSSNNVQLEKKIDGLIENLRFVDILRERGKRGVSEFQWIEEVSRELKNLFEESLNNLANLAS